MATTKKSQVGFEQEYAFRSVELFKTETLGAGAYGAVCKAKCDQLICAAKLLYPVLFQVQVSDPGKEHRQPMQRFELECHFLSLINHPNIIQYLGTYRDPETNAPVLLMELMDESLTHFLNLSAEDVPYHIQVNLSYDIAQALAFLHANRIIHRDLSSNNVLLLAGRAKVADFGMSKLDAKFATMTTCPGASAYMPPEALSEPPVYTEKLDNFSLGVIIVQMLTRKYPSPSDRFITRELVDPSFPSQKVTAKVAVQETQRREAHISLIDTAHPLLPTAVECLSDKDTDRPTAQELCQRFALLKEQTKYSDSLEQDKDHLLREKNRLMAEQEQLVQAQQRELEELVTQVQQLRDRLKDVPQEDVTVQLREELKLQERQIQTFRTQTSEKDNQLRAKDLEIQVLREQQAICDRNLARSEQLRLDTEKKHQDVIETHREEARCSEAKIQALKKDLSYKDKEVRELQTQLSQLATTISDKRAPEQNESDKEYNKDELQPRTKEQSPDRPPAQSSTAANSTPVGTPRGERKRHVWKRPVPAAPSCFKAGSVVVYEQNAYFKGAGSNTVYKFDASARRWDTVAHHQLYGFALVYIEGTLTTVGGYIKEESSGKIYDLVENDWVENLPEMPVRRDRPTAVYADGHLIVLGGCDDHSHPLQTVSILEISSRQWSKTATSLPFPMYKVSAVVCQGNIFLTTGEGTQESKARIIFTCTVSGLIQSGKPLTLGARIKRVSQKKLWQVLSELPVSQSCLLTANEDLLAVGGQDSSAHSSKNVYKYNASTNVWEVVAEMTKGRSSCLAAIFMGNLLMVVGGHNIRTKDVEAISLPI